jgi:hypothetical protein
MNRIQYFASLFLGVLMSTALNSASQTRAYCTIPGGDLYSLNFNQCSYDFIGSSNQGFGDIAITEDGKLFGHVGGQLYQVDTLTAEATFIGATGLEAVSMVAFDNQTLFVEAMMSLYAVDVTDASTTLIGYIGYQAAGDLTWFGDDLYLMAAGQLIRITMNDDFSAIENVEPVNSLDAQIPICEGLVAANFGAEGNWIVGLCGTDVYRICEVDGTFELVCDDLLVYGFPGGTAYRLPQQDPSIAPCTLTSVAESDLVEPLRMFIDEASDKLIVRSDETLGFSGIKVYSSNGQLVEEYIFSGNYAEFDVSQFPAGVYMFSLIHSSKPVHSEKLSILH